MNQKARMFDLLQSLPSLNQGGIIWLFCGSAQKGSPGIKRSSKKDMDLKSNEEI